MEKKSSYSQEGRARDTRRQRTMSRMGKLGVVTATVVTAALWGYLFMAN